jgi:hypothetical protein
MTTVLSAAGLLLLNGVLLVMLFREPGHSLESAQACPKGRSMGRTHIASRVVEGNDDVVIVCAVVVMATPPVVVSMPPVY